MSDSGFLFQKITKEKNATVLESPYVWKVDKPSHGIKAKVENHHDPKKGKQSMEHKYFARGQPSYSAELVFYSAGLCDRTIQV